MTIYCIPGLGADERVFRNLSLRSGSVKPLRWLSPAKTESMAAYAGRMSEQIDGIYPYCLLGVSFGGIVAIEMARLKMPSITIVVSSARRRNELPWYGRLIGSLGLHHLAPVSLARVFPPLLYKAIGAGSDSDRALIRLLLSDTDIHLFRWSVDRALRWEFVGEIPGLTHIHGTADRILPARYVKPDHWVKGGTHLMVFNRAGEISAIIDSRLSQVQDERPSR